MKLYLKSGTDIVEVRCRNVANTPDIATLFLKRLQNGARSDCWSQKCDIALFNEEMLSTRKFIANECCFSLLLTKEFGMKVFQNTLLKRLWRPKRGKSIGGTTENFTLMYFVISPFRQVLLGVSKSIEIRQERRERSRDEVFIGNIGQETYNDEITYRRRRRSRVTVNLKK